MNVTLRLAEQGDIELYEAHLTRVIHLSGANGHPYFTVHAPGSFQFASDRAARTLERWSLGLSTPSWMRTWLAFCGNEIAGHVELFGASFPTMLHRATFGMGLERAFQGQGFGGVLTRHAIAWAKAETNLTWLDLNVYESNVRAVRLYEKCGFLQKGRTEDSCRIGADALVDLSMSLRVERGRDS